MTIMHRSSIWPAAAGICLMGLLAWSALAPRRVAAESDAAFRVVRMTTMPLAAGGGENLLLCAANVNPARSVNVELAIQNAFTGEVVAQRQLLLAPLGSQSLAAAEEPPDPCLRFVVPVSPPATNFAAPLALYLGRVALNPQPLPPGIYSPYDLTASLQVYALDADGNPSGFRMAPLLPPDPCRGCTLNFRAH
jgi:hypothetical protein